MAFAERSTPRCRAEVSHYLDVHPVWPRRGVGDGWVWVVLEVERALEVIEGRKGIVQEWEALGSE
jgi:hypothetical protein